MLLRPSQSQRNAARRARQWPRPLAEREFGLDSNGVGRPAACSSGDRCRRAVRGLRHRRRRARSGGGFRARRDQVSRRHSCSRRRRARARRGSGSANGTFVNSGLIVGQQVVEHGDRIQVGNTLLELVAPGSRQSSASSRRSRRRPARTTASSSRGSSRSSPAASARSTGRPLRPPRRDRWLPRPERRGQVDDGAHADDAAPSTGGRPGRRVRRGEPGGGVRRDRRRAPGGRARPPAERLGAHAAPWQCRACRSRSGRAVGTS